MGCYALIKGVIDSTGLLTRQLGANVAVGGIPVLYQVQGCLATGTHLVVP